MAIKISQDAQRIFYHGSASCLRCIDPDWFGEDGELLCASASVNVAQRYGAVLTKICVADLTEDQVFKVALHEWSSATMESIQDLKARGILAVIVIGSMDIYDFPVDTLFVLHQSAVLVDLVLEVKEVQELDDGIPTYHDPESPSDLGWDWYVKDLYNGDEAAALADRQLN